MCGCVGVCCFQSVLRKSVGMLALPYFPWASMDWAKYPQVRHP